MADAGADAALAADAAGLTLSVRARLALWYAGAFTLLLGVFAVAAYAFLARTSLARVDEFLEETAQTVADAAARGRGGGATLGEVLAEFRPRDVTILALDGASGQVVTASHVPRTPRRTPPVAAEELAALLRGASRDRAAYITVRGAQGPARVVLLPTVAAGRAVVVAAAQSLAARERMLRDAEAALALGLPAMLAAATLGGYWLARASMRPVDEMAARADRIGASTLHERLAPGRARDELGRLAAVFNRLLVRLDVAFDQQRRFAADASHELRTPVAVIRGEAELALARTDRSPAELRDALGVIQIEARRLAAVVDDLFLLARADAGDRQIRHDALYVNDVAAEAVRALRSVALAKGVALTYDEPAADLPFVGDEALLRRLVGNLLDNAVKYTPSGGRCVLAAESRDDAIAITVRDTGPGVPDEARARLFDRFFRARRDEPGAGLGLAIARWIAEAHGGSLALAESGPDGSTFVVSLPAAGGG